MLASVTEKEEVSEARGGMLAAGRQPGTWVEVRAVAVAIDEATAAGADAGAGGPVLLVLRAILPALARSMARRVRCTTHLSPESLTGEHRR